MNVLCCLCRHTNSVQTYSSSLSPADVLKVKSKASDQKQLASKPNSVVPHSLEKLEERIKPLSLQSATKLNEIIEKSKVIEYFLRVAKSFLVGELAPKGSNLGKTYSLVHQRLSQVATLLQKCVNVQEIKSQRLAVKMDETVLKQELEEIDAGFLKLEKNVQNLKVQARSKEERKALTVLKNQYAWAQEEKAYLHNKRAALEEIRRIAVHLLNRASALSKKNTISQQEEQFLEQEIDWSKKSVILFRKVFSEIYKEQEQSFQARPLLELADLVVQQLDALALAVGIDKQETPKRMPT